MIKSSKVSLKFCNKNRRTSVHSFIKEYQKVVSNFVDILWEIDEIPKFLGKELISGCKTWLSARAVQCAGKQSSGIVRGCKKKQSKRLYQINKFKSLGMHKKARILTQIYNKAKISKPNIQTIQPELDSRFVKLDLNNATSFDGWVSLTCIGEKIKIAVPFKKTKHFNEIALKGKIKHGVRLSVDGLTFMFELPEAKLAINGKTIGIDIGLTTTLTCSDGQQIEEDCHGHTFKTICQRLSRRRKGSKNFYQTEKHRSNYIHWSMNQLDLSGVQKVCIENIKNLRKGKKSSRLMSHWNYAELVEKLEDKLNEAGVQIVKVSPTYTSQRCSSCGWVRKGNRKGKWFKCDKCSFECDADLNGSLNISFNLPAVLKEERLQHKNRKGFYWNVVGEEPIVPHAQKQNHIFQYEL